MWVIISYDDIELKLRDIYELLVMHGKKAIFDGDIRAVIIEDAPKELVEELDNRGVKYKLV